MKIPHNRPVERAIVVSFSVLLLGVSGAAAWWAWRSQSPPLSQTPPNPVERPLENPSPAPAPITAPAEIYWLEVRNNEIHLVPVPFIRNPRQSDAEVLSNALNYLLKNPRQVGLTSTIPTGTRLLGLRVTPEGIYVNLSQEFQQGGGSASMVHRVAQVLYTVTSLNPNANVYLSVEGKLLNADNPLGGEGVILPEPLTREQFAKDFSLIAQSNDAR